MALAEAEAEQAVVLTSTHATYVLSSVVVVVVVVLAGAPALAGLRAPVAVGALAYS